MRRFVLGLLALAIAACGGDSKNSTQPSTVPAKPPVQATVGLTLTATNGGNAQLTDFHLKVTGNGQTWYALVAGPNTILSLDPGAYQIDVDQSYPEGYTSVPCQLTAILGATPLCNVSIMEIVQSCDLNLSRFVYSNLNDDRLKKVFAGSGCMSMTGRIGDSESGDDNPDSDLVVDFDLDPDYKKFLNAVNLAPKPKGNDGFMVVEAICQGTIKDPTVAKACSGFSGKKIALPPKGMHVKITGIVVIDQIHGWVELHPITSIIVLPH